MKILLTGTIGLLARQVIGQLEVRGYKWTTHSNLGGTAVNELAFTSTAEHFANRLEDCDAVVHFTRPTIPAQRRGEKYYYQAEIDLLQALVEASKRAKVKRFVLVSTANTVGPGSRDRPATEWKEFAFFRLGSATINSNFLMERWVLEQSARGFPAVVVNPTKVVGDTNYWPFFTKRMRTDIRYKKPWVPAGGANFVSPLAAAKGVLGALEYGRIGERYLLAGENTDYLSFFALLDETLGRRPQLRWRLPPFMLRLRGRVGVLGQQLTAQSYFMDIASSRLLSLERYYSGHKAQQELGMPLIPLKQALEEMVRHQNSPTTLAY